VSYEGGPPPGYESTVTDAPFIEGNEIVGGYGFPELIDEAPPEP
jgi:hypothetical protein